jgi:hypothetical protein
LKCIYFNTKTQIKYSNVLRDVWHFLIYGQYCSCGGKNESVVLKFAVALERRRIRCSKPNAYSPY